MADVQQFCTFVLGDSLLGIEVERVQEIIRHQALTRVPLAPDALAGLINLRGDIVPAIDLRACLGLPPRGGDNLPTNVVIRTEDGAVSLLVDEIGDVVTVDEDTYEPAPENLRGELRGFLRGVYKLKDELLLILATEATLTASTAVTPNVN